MASDFTQVFDLLLDGASTLVCMKDVEHRYIYAKSELESLYGVLPGELIGKTVDAFVAVDVAADLHAKEDAVMALGRPVRTVELITVGGQLHTWQTVRFPNRDRSGLIIGSGFVAIDLQDREGKGTDSYDVLEIAKNRITELQRLMEEMKLRAAIDALTGVWNRARIEESAQNEIYRLDRYGHPVSLIFIDLDHFKRVNDTWGHVVGDEVLKGFCDIVRSCMRATDLFGRWGGEEFILLLPNTGSMSARLVAERIRMALAQHDFPHVGQMMASFGVATCQSKETFTHWIERADAAMYRAKENGRNRVETDLMEARDTEQPENVALGFVGLIWHNAYECGNPVIDRQHRALFDAANTLLAALLGGQQPKEDVTQIINALLAEVVQHFEDEEVIFRAAGFPEADEHHQIHNQLVAKALHLANRYAEDKLEIGELFAFLVHEVVAKHILSDDRKFFPYITAQPQ